MLALNQDSANQELDQNLSFNRLSPHGLGNTSLKACAGGLWLIVSLLRSVVVSLAEELLFSLKVRLSDDRPPALVASLVAAVPPIAPSLQGVLHIKGSTKCLNDESFLAGTS